MLFRSLDTAEAKKQILEGHEWRIWVVKISEDGLKIASHDSDYNAVVWLRYNEEAEFEQYTKHSFENYEDAHWFLGTPFQCSESCTTTNLSLSRAQRELLNTTDSENGSGDYGFAAEVGFFEYEEDSQWITKGGKKLWWIPEDFRGKSSQHGERIVIYNSPSVVMFELANNSTIK